MKKIKCIDCDNCVDLYLDSEGYLSNDCKNSEMCCLYSLEKWFCKDFKLTDKNKAKIRTIKGSEK